MSLFAPLLLNQSDPFDHFRALLGGNSESLDLGAYTQMDWKETLDAHVFEIDLPGFAKEDVKLGVKENRVLCIKAEKKAEQEEQEEKTKLKWHCRERRSSGVVSREFRLPENSKVDGVRASMCDGVLTVTVPKDESETLKKHKKEVQIFEEDGEGVGMWSLGLSSFPMGLFGRRGKGVKWRESSI